VSTFFHRRSFPCATGWLGLSLVVYVAILSCSASVAQKHDFWGDDGNVTTPPGQRAFNSNCAGCHGLDGRGSDKGIDLAASAHLRNLPDAQVSNIISNGIPGTGMPAFHSLTPPQTRTLVSYVRILQGNLRARTPPGNATRGKEIFFGKGECSGCHAISGEGGFLGPDLSTYGWTLPAQAIRDEIVKPNRTESPGYRSATLTTSNGDRMEGVIRNEDNFSVQLQSRDGNFHFFQKSNLRAVERPAQPLMPTNYGERLSKSELDDLVSYLMKAAAAPNKPQSLSKNEEPTE
jgi:cytochrome c oxidase cbb3-type subunit III